FRATADWRAIREFVFIRIDPFALFRMTGLEVKLILRLDQQEPAALPRRTQNDHRRGQCETACWSKTGKAPFPNSLASCYGSTPGVDSNRFLITVNLWYLDGRSATAALRDCRKTR